MPKKFKATGDGVVEAGPYRVKWWAHNSDQHIQNYGEGPYHLPIGTTIVVDGKLGSKERLRLVEGRAAIDGVAVVDQGTSSSYREIEPNMPGPGQFYLQVAKLPTKPAKCTVNSRIALVVRVWDIVRVNDARRIKAPQREDGYAAGSDRWTIAPGASVTSELGFPVSIEHDPHNSDNIKVDLSALRTKYKAVRWTVFPTETSAGLTNRDGMSASGFSGEKDKWIAKLMPEAPRLTASKSFPELWVRYYVDLVIGEYPFSYVVEVAPVQ